MLSDLQSEYINMATSTTNVNVTLNKISSAVAAAKRAKIRINTAFEGDLFCCISLDQNINLAIDLNSEQANLKLNSLLQQIYCFTPVNQAMQGAR